MFVKTEEGSGSTFGFRLQLAIEETPPEVELVVAPRSMRVLVADPSPTSGATLAKLLHEGNFVELVSDGPSARIKLMEAAQAQRAFDLLLVDLRLAGAFEALDVIGGEKFGAVPMVVAAPVTSRPRPPPGSGPAARPRWLLSSATTSSVHHRVLRGGPPDAVAAKKKDEPSSAMRGPCVLVAEDHPSAFQRITRSEKLGVAYGREQRRGGAQALRNATSTWC
jgi:CheY-like chemotaxis protein